MYNLNRKCKEKNGKRLNLDGVKMLAVTTEMNVDGDTSEETSLATVT